MMLHCQPLLCSHALAMPMCVYRRLHLCYTSHQRGLEHYDVLSFTDIEFTSDARRSRRAEAAANHLRAEQQQDQAIDVPHKQSAKEMAAKTCRGETVPRSMREAADFMARRRSGHSSAAVQL